MKNTGLQGFLKCIADDVGANKSKPKVIATMGSSLSEEHEVNLMNLISTICTSQPADWNHIVCWGTGSGPSYRDQLDFYDLYEGAQHVVVATSHSDVCSYIPDLSISLAFGLKWMDSFKEPWVERFPDPHASAFFIDVFTTDRSSSERNMFPSMEVVRDFHCRRVGMN